MRKLLIILGALIGLTIVAAIVAPYVISQDTIKQKLIATVEEKTGKKIVWLELLPDAQAAGESWSQEKMDLSALNTFNGKFELTADKLVARKVKVGKPAMKIAVDNGNVIGSMVTPDIYGGKGNVSFR